MSGERGANRNASGSTTEPTIRDILRSDPSLTPLESYDRAFAFLGKAEPALSEAEKKEQYLTKYRLYKFLVQGVIIFGISIIFCILALIREWGFNSLIQSKTITGIIPPGNIIVDIVSGSGTIIPISASDETKLNAIINIVRVIWVAWLLYRCVVDFVSPGVFFATRSVREQYYLPEKMLLVTFAALVIASSLIYIPYMALDDEPSLISPSVFDKPIILAIKDAAIVSLGYWILGLFVFLIVTFLRQTWSQSRG